MAVFRYKMQGILDVKEKLENRAKQDFAEANMKLEAEKQQLRAYKQSLIEDIIKFNPNQDVEYLRKLAIRSLERICYA